MFISLDGERAQGVLQGENISAVIKTAGFEAPV